MFSLTFKAFVMFVTFLPFQSNLYVVLARGKGPKNGFHKGHLKTKILVDSGIYFRLFTTGNTCPKVFFSVTPW